MSFSVLYLLSKPQCYVQSSYSISFHCAPSSNLAFVQGHVILHMVMLNLISIQAGTFQKNREGLGVVAEAVPCAKTCGAGFMPVSS